MHAAILDTNTKHSDFVMRRLVRLMCMVKSDGIDIPNKNSHLITLVVLKYENIDRQSRGDTVQISVTSPGNDILLYLYISLYRVKYCK